MKTNLGGPCIRSSPFLAFSNYSRQYIDIYFFHTLLVARARYIHTLSSLLYLPFPFLSNAARHLSAVLVFFWGFFQTHVLYPPFHPFFHPGKKKGGCFFFFFPLLDKKERRRGASGMRGPFFFLVTVVVVLMLTFFFSLLLRGRRGLCACRARVLGFFFLPSLWGMQRGSCIYLD